MRVHRTSSSTDDTTHSGRAGFRTIDRSGEPASSAWDAVAEWKDERRGPRHQPLGNGLTRSRRDWRRGDEAIEPHQVEQVSRRRRAGDGPATDTTDVEHGESRTSAMIASVLDDQTEAGIRYGLGGAGRAAWGTRWGVRRTCGYRGSGERERSLSR